MSFGDNTEKHPSMGMIGFTHAQSTGTNLVGSEFKHTHFVTLRIHRSQKHRDLSREWFFAREQTDRGLSV